MYSIPTYADHAIGTKDSSTSKRWWKFFNILSLNLKYELVYTFLYGPQWSGLSLPLLHLFPFCAFNIVTGLFLSHLLKPQYWFPKLPFYSCLYLVFLPFLFIACHCTKCEFHEGLCLFSLLLCPKTHFWVSRTYLLKIYEWMDKWIDILVWNRGEKKNLGWIML